MSSKLLIILSVLAVSLAQRSTYVRRPVGYPVLETTSPASTTSAQSNDLGNRFAFGETTSTTTQRLPVEALGDRALVDQLSKLPTDQQPFWLLNWRALEEHRKQGNTFQYRPSHFIDSTSGGQRPRNMAFF